MEEGNEVPADAIVLEQNDLSLNESIITGESMPVEKSETGNNNFLYQGSTVNSGKCYAPDHCNGQQYNAWKLGKFVSEYLQPKTLLQQQVGNLVKKLAIFGFSAFIVILAVNYFRSRDIVNSILFAPTLAMAVTRGNSRRFFIIYGLGRILYGEKRNYFTSTSNNRKSWSS